MQNIVPDLTSDDTSTDASGGILLLMAILALIGVVVFIARPDFLYSHRTLQGEHPAKVELPSAMRRAF